MKESKDEAEIVKILTKQYDTDSKTIEKDLYDFVNLLLNHQLAEKL
jgi:hypothetical protein